MYFLYSLLLSLLFVLAVPFLLIKLIKGKYRKGLKQRFGFLPVEIIEKFKNEPTIWIHAVSVGETVAASSIVSEIKKRLPGYKILFSTVTDTGLEMAEKIIDADSLIYFPLDFTWVARKVLRSINPELIVITETELWPNYIHEAKKMGIRIMLANGRISDNSARQYKYLGSFLQSMLCNIDILSMQSEFDVEYVNNFGIEHNKVLNTGNTKFDQTYAEVSLEEKEKIYHEYKIDPSQPLIVVGSTHDDEEEQLISTFKKLKETFPDLLMILAPRHIERAEEIGQLYLQHGINTVLRTEIAQRDPQKDDVILLNTIGELAKTYSIADLVFVGGSLIDDGGHNILEPSAHGKLVFFGPYMYDFKDSTRLVLEHGVGIQVKDADELTAEMFYYLKNKKELIEKGRKALEMIEVNKGAAVRNAELAVELIKKGRKDG